MLFTGATKGCGLRFLVPMLSNSNGTYHRDRWEQWVKLQSKRAQALSSLVERLLVNLCWRD